MRKFNSFAICYFLVIFGFESLGAVEPLETLSCQWIKPLQLGMMDNHITYVAQKLDDSFQSRLVVRFIEQHDGMKIYLTEPDVQLLKQSLNKILSLIRRKDCSFLMKTQAILLGKMEKQILFAHEFLGPDFVHDEKAAFAPLQKNVGWAKTDVEAKERLKKFLQYQVALRQFAGFDLEKAKRSTVQSMERELQVRKSTSHSDLIFNYLKVFSRMLDAQSTVLDSSYFKKFDDSQNEKMVGVGIGLSNHLGFPKISSIDENSPADQTGLLEPGDFLISSSSKRGVSVSLVDLNPKEIEKNIFGKVGTKIRLTVLRIKNNNFRTFEIELERKKSNSTNQKMHVRYLQKQRKGQNFKLAIIKVLNFYGDPFRGPISASADLKEKILEAHAGGTDGIILDLTDCSGGSIREAVHSASFFVGSGVLAIQSSPLRRRDIKYEVKNSPALWRGPLVVLTSRTTSFAGELAAGVLKDFNRAVIVGSKTTAGHGSVQTIVPIPFEIGALRVTYGLLYTPSGRSIHLDGVASDIDLSEIIGVDVLNEWNFENIIVPTRLETFFDGNGPGMESAEKYKERIVSLNRYSLGRLKSRTASKERLSPYAEAADILVDLIKQK